MATKKHVKTIAEKLNEYQLAAIEAALHGSYLPIIQCCVDCQKAINKAVEVSNQGVPGWGKPTADHYLAVQKYLRGFIKGQAANLLLTHELERLDDNG